jgi:hypothetical protein
MSETARDIDHGFERLRTIGRLETAWRPPEAAQDHRLQTAVDALLASYPCLERDDGYVAFLRRYGGALLVRDDGLLLSLFGFSHDIGMHLVEGPGDMVSDGCLIIGDMIVPRVPSDPRDTAAVGFGFDVTGERRWGVYRIIDGGAPSWYCATFLEWLTRLVERSGWLLDGVGQTDRAERE